MNGATRSPRLLLPVPSLLTPYMPGAGEFPIPVATGQEARQAANASERTDPGPVAFK